MTGELYINNKDAYTVFGISMGDDFLNALMAPDPLKEFPEYKSRLEHGKQVLYTAPKLDEREITLTFFLEGGSAEEYLSRYRAFKAELNNGYVVLRVPATGETYRLTYLRSSSFAQNRKRTFSKIAVKFNEPNPDNRA